MTLAAVLPLETPRLRIEARAPDDLGRAAVVLNATGEIVGDAGLVRAPAGDERTRDFFIELAPSHRGAGYGSEVARALLRTAFGPLRLVEVGASVPATDARARRFLERGGFRLASAASAAGAGVGTVRFAAHAPAVRAVPIVKMCGMTSPWDAELAVAAGAAAIGMIFAPSERRVTLETARAIVRSLPPLTRRVAVFVDAAGDDVRRICDELGAIPQFSGGESLAYCERFGGAGAIRVVRVAGDADAASLARAAEGGPSIVPFFETAVAGTAGGTGVRFDWTLAATASATRPVGIGGGLTPENVAECVRVVRPYAVDVRSGVETDGHKSFGRMQAFVAAATGAGPESDR